MKRFWAIGPTRVLAICLGAGLLVFAVLLPDRTNGSEAVPAAVSNGAPPAVRPAPAAVPAPAAASAAASSSTQAFDVAIMDKEAKDLFSAIAGGVNIDQLPLDFSESLQRLSRAAEKGDTAALYLINHAYESGVGFPEDRALNQRWHDKVISLEAEGRETGSGVAPVKKYLAALQSYQHAAEAGDPGAQLYMGLKCASGKDEPVNMREAVLWFQKAAAQGSTSAENNLGVLYHNGDGIPKDNATAIQWFSKAAESGSAVAQYNLGRVYLGGNGAPQNFALASDWLIRSARQGSEPAQALLSSMYASGNGVQGNVATAYMWLNLASAADENARAARDKIEKLVPPEQVMEGQRLTREWLAQNQHPGQ
jgi:TPR repeat protein